MMNITRKKLIASAIAIAGVAATTCAQADWTFGSVSGSGSTTLSSNTSGDPTVTFSGAHAANGGTLSTGALGTSIVAAGSSCATCGTAAANANTYGINGFASGATWVVNNPSSNLQYYGGLGLGMASDSTLGTSPNHAIDNGPSTDASDKINGLGNTESVLLSFSSSVVLSSIGIGWKFGDADISLFRYTGNAAPSLNNTATSLGGMSTAGWQLVGNYGDLAVDISSPFSAVNSGNLGSSWWLVSAYNSSYGSATLGSVDQGNDFFKLFGVNGTKCTSAVSGVCGPSLGGSSGVPEPASWALAAMALLGLRASRRRNL